VGHKESIKRPLWYLKHRSNMASRDLMVIKLQALVTPKIAFSVLSVAYFSIR